MSYLSLAGAILAVGFIILVHEAGHYFVARWCKMRVDRFSIGLGPAIATKRHGETDFSIGWIPFGGFVYISGMMISEEVDPNDQRSYANRPVWQRFATLFAGPATNYLAAFFLAILFFSLEGVPLDTARYVVGGVDEGFDAVGKLENGDVITKINGEPLYSVENRVRATKGFVQRVQESGGQALALTVLRDGKETEVSVLAKPNPQFEAVKDLPPEERTRIPQYRIGIILQNERANVGVFGAIGHAFVYPVLQTKTLVSGLYQLATKKEARKDATLMGPVGITTEIKKQIDAGFVYFLSLLMLLNVYIGLFNLFPLPALDGGRLVFLVYEMVTRRRANPKIEATVHGIGFAALMLLMVVVTFKDCQRACF